MSTSREWQLDDDSARRYEEIVVPLVLGPAARALVAWAAPQPGERVLDAGCGTGVAARVALELVGPTGTVAGIDVNAGMLGVAATLAPDITFQQANVTALPFPDGSFDLILCAQVLQFIPDRAAALAEMERVLAPGGRVALSVWAPLDESPYFDAQVSVITAHLGADTAGGLAAGFTLTSVGELEGLLAPAGFADIEIATTTLELPLGRLEDIVAPHIMATPMAGPFSQAGPELQERIVRALSERLTTYRQDDGTTQAPFRMLLARAYKQG